jgi:hypothetical protein
MPDEFLGTAPASGARATRASLQRGDVIMATAEINAGICGFKTTVHAQATDDRIIHLTIESECKAVCKLGEQLQDVDPYREFTWRRGGPLTLESAPKCLSHPACPVPSGIIKVVEIEAGLALPADVSIKLSK